MVKRDASDQGPQENDALAIEEAETRRRILRMQAQREALLLEEAEEQNAKRIEAKRLRAFQNAQRQSDLAKIEQQKQLTIRNCRHKQGGFRQKLNKGDGKPVVTCFVMPDGVTNFLQCSRCRAAVYTPHPSLKDRNPALYAEQKELYDRMLALHEESGLDAIKGPTFIFSRNGVPFIPERKGTSEAAAA